MENGFATQLRTGWFTRIKLTNLSILYTQQLNRRPDSVKQWLYIATPDRLRAGVEQMRTEALYFHMRNTRDSMSLFAATALRHGSTGHLWERAPHIEMCYGGWVRLKDLSDRFLLFAKQGERPLNHAYKPLAVNNLWGVLATDENCKESSMELSRSGGPLLLIRGAAAAPSAPQLPPR